MAPARAALGRVFALLGLCLAVALPAAAATPAVGEDPLRLVDLTGEFDAFWARSSEMETGARVAAFRSEFAGRIPGFYDPDRLRRTPQAYDAHVAAAFDAYAEQRAGIREVSRRFAELFAPARSTFEAVFGPFERPQAVYLLHSLGEMDGGTRSLPQGPTLIFGADMIARFHLSHRIQPFFHHELFHVRHEPAFGDCGGVVWCDLWVEGLATYASAQLNPDATDDELLLNIPEPIRPAVDAHRPEAICAVVARLDSSSGADSRALFGFGRMSERLPPRFGYYVGYLAAVELGRDRPLAELTALSQQEVRPMLEQALRSLATCDG
jgi:hypothetical protein